MTSFSNMLTFAVSLYNENMNVNNNLVANTTIEVLTVLESFYYVHGKYILSLARKGHIILYYLMQKHCMQF